MRARSRRSRGGGSRSSPIPTATAGPSRRSSARPDPGAPGCGAGTPAPRGDPAPVRRTAPGDVNARPRLPAMTTQASDPAESGPRPVRAPRGTELSTRGWQQEAVLRMLMNNLDPEVAENPDALVVYGGTGRAARS